MLSIEKFKLKFLKLQDLRIVTDILIEETKETSGNSFH